MQQNSLLRATAPEAVSTVTREPSREIIALAPPAVDFSMAGYLGLKHSRDELRHWDRMSSGRPAAMEDEGDLAEELAVRMAALQGCEAASFATSTLHLFWDLFGLFSEEEIAIYLDEGAYQISQWGVERATSQGVPVSSFPHHCPETLSFLIAQNRRHRRRPIVVVDGVSSSMWSPAPLTDYLQCLEPFGGLLVVDDTQATGLLGHSPVLESPFGLGGGGSFRWHELDSPNMVLVSSLAKGFGVPIAVLSGSTQMVEWFQANSQTRVHCSPPGFSQLHAVEHALDVNEDRGNELRGRLAENVQHLRAMCQQGGIPPKGSLFPIQIFELPGNAGHAWVDSELKAGGVRALIQQNEYGRSQVVFCVTANHRPEEIKFGADILVKTFNEMTNSE